MKAINQKKIQCDMRDTQRQYFVKLQSQKREIRMNTMGRLRIKKVIKFKVGKERKLWNRYYT